MIFMCHNAHVVIRGQLCRVSYSPSSSFTRVLKITLKMIACIRAYLRSHWVFNAHHADARKFIENVILIVPVRLRAAGEVTVGHTDGTEPVTGHGLNHLLNHLIPVSGPEDTGFPCPTEDLAAPGGGKGRR